MRRMILSVAAVLRRRAAGDCGKAAPSGAERQRYADLARRGRDLPHTVRPKRLPGRSVSRHCSIRTTPANSARPRCHSPRAHAPPGTPIRADRPLVVISGSGWVQEWGGQKQDIGPGDVIWTPPGVKHWHGATEGEAMTHIAIQSVVDGQVVDWMEHVTDDQYLQ